MRSSWNKGFTKNNHPSVLKISKTMRKRKIDNFFQWRKDMILKGMIKVNYPDFYKDGNLAELIGVILGDGHICKFARTEGLRISSNSNNLGFVRRYVRLLKIVFQKEPSVAKVKNSNCIIITIYEKSISKRLKIPTGSRKNGKFPIPQWILNNKNYLRRYLRGLYEAEGSSNIHKPTSTYKFIFSNKNISLLNNVYKSLQLLGFSAHKSKYKVQVSKKADVLRVAKFLKFRHY